MIMAGYSGTPLVKKLGIKPGSKVYLFKPPVGYMDWIHPLPEGIKVKTRLSGNLILSTFLLKIRKH
jgi:hypothetical protein